MKKLTIKSPHGAADIKVSVFEGIETGNEYHMVITGASHSNSKSQISKIEDAYRYALNSLGLSSETSVFRRLFVSDFINQKNEILQSNLAGKQDKVNPVAVSIVEQPPLSDGKYALWAYHISDCLRDDKEKINNGVLLKRKSLTHIWFVGLVDDSKKNLSDSYQQTQRIFDRFEQHLKILETKLEKDVIRTWVYVQNVDLNYAGMVSARRKFFKKHGLNEESHYIASTGIEGRCANTGIFVLMDAYVVKGLKPEQIHFLEAPDHLGSTSDYGVTFERGVCVDYKDRRHIIISGTASIDPRGNTLFLGDVLRQTKRAVENVEFLLKNGGATFDDIIHMIVYLRDNADYSIVSNYIERAFPNIPKIFVRAPVCRPEWLVEIECMAIVSASNPQTTSF